MNLIQAMTNHIMNSLQNQEITTSMILSVLVVAGILASYEFIVYQVVLHRSLYNKAFNIAIAVLPLFISTIILCLQSNLVITLGTIGALAIIRFRTAVKDPVDLIFILWSLHIGIICGCQLYEMAVITSLAATIVLIVLERVNRRTKSHILVVHSKSAQKEDEIRKLLEKNTKRYRIKSRNYTEKGMDYVFEIVVKEAESLACDMEQEDAVERFSLMEYDSDDVL
ncbi:DUF4956 domain-containing protein [Parablautia muri]|uniref:DUF4956 domain-containing protein n=1 Tax=Parablautia muri TaxID=2320879 RepID=A0A9X5GQK6_9FIRM|nr:DUF4956 domain-containing protein [Parablautia muri]NBJ91299.1 DUF4956 domain-containing protein [Parablautia muri]